MKPVDTLFEIDLHSITEHITIIALDFEGYGQWVIKNFR
jgi:hypothetical protein